MSFNQKTSDSTTYFNFFLTYNMSVQNCADFQRNDADGNVASYYKRVLVELPIDHVCLVRSAIFLFDEAIHGVESVQSVGLFLAMNKDSIRKLLSIFFHVQNVVRQIHFLDILGVDEGEDAVAVHFVEFANFVGKSFEIFAVGESTQQLSCVMLICHRLKLSCYGLT